MKQLSYQAIKEVYLKKGYSFPVDSSKTILKITGIRTNTTIPDCFDDFLTVCWEENGVEHFFGGMGTTDPGVYYLKNPLNIKGTAILVPQQCIGVWQLGLHKGYKALTQIKDFLIYRDNNKDGVLDKKGSSILSGLSGINCHRASDSRTSTIVDKWSAGCQVWANPLLFDKMITLAEKQVKEGKKTFTYTLLTEDDF